MSKSPLIIWVETPFLGLSKVSAQFTVADFVCAAKRNAQKCTVENTDKLRTIDQHNKIIEMITAGSPNLFDSKGKLDVQKTFGVKNYCILNDLNYFSSIENRSLDPMHDIFGGAMCFVLSRLFALFSSNNVIDKGKIAEKIRSYDYGILERRNIPSPLFFNKKNLNQNASQMRCLFRHIPFIFADLLSTEDSAKRKLIHNSWKTIEYLLKIDQIVSSSVVRDEDAQNLKIFTYKFLKHIKITLGAGIIPKLHHLIHYPNTYKVMGTVVQLQVMRGDAKHQTFTRYAKRTNNFINICKSLAEKHQIAMASILRSTIFEDKITVGKKSVYFAAKNCPLKVEFESHQHLFADRFKNSNNVIIKDYLIMNLSYMKKGLFIVYGNHMHKIEAVIQYEKSYVLLCTQFIASKYHKFANSIELEETSEVSLIDVNRLQCHKSYNSKFLNGKIQIIADTLNLNPIYEHLKNG